MASGGRGGARINVIFTLYLVFSKFNLGVEARRLAPEEAGCSFLWGPPPGTSLRRWRDAGREGSLGPQDSPDSTGLTKLVPFASFRKVPLFWRGSRGWSINSWNTNKITSNAHIFPTSCGSRRGKRSLHCWIHRRHVQVQTTQLDLQLCSHCLCSAKMQTCKYCMKRTAPGTFASLEALMNAFIPI